MVIALIITAGVIAACAMVCFKGITIKYDKRFTVDDKRNQVRFTQDELKLLEAKLNTDRKVTTEQDSVEHTIGPMDAVIAEIQDLFGPVSDETHGGK